MSARDTLLAVVVGCLWGVNFLVIDWGMTGTPPLLFAAVRFVFVFFPAALFVARPDVPWRVLAAVGMLVSLGQFGFLYVAIAVGMHPGVAALVLQGQVVLTMLIAVVALSEVPTGMQLAGVMMGTLGLVIVGVGLDPSVPLVAFLLCLLAALSWAAGNVVTRAAAVPSGLGLTVWSAVVVPGPLLALSLLIDGPAEVAVALASFSWRPALATLYTVVLASLVGYGVFNTLLSRNSSSAVVPWALLAPVVAMAGAWAVLGSRPNLAESVGGVVLLAGVLVASRSRSRDASRSDEMKARVRHELEDSL